jgi:hypothetical protein
MTKARPTITPKNIRIRSPKKNMYIKLSIGYNVPYLYSINTRSERNPIMVNKLKQQRRFYLSSRYG